MKREIKSKSVEIYDYKEAGARLRPQFHKWVDGDIDFAKELHKEYMKCPSFSRLCGEIGCSVNTATALFDKYSLPRKMPQMAREIDSITESNQNSLIPETTVTDPEAETFDDLDNMPEIATDEPYIDVEAVANSVSRYRRVRDKLTAVANLDESDLRNLSPTEFEDLSNRMDEVITNVNILKAEIARGAYHVD